MVTFADTLKFVNSLQELCDEKDDNVKYVYEYDYIVRDYPSINRSELIKHLPNHLKTDSKLDYLYSFTSTISLNEFAKFLRYQTLGEDYVVYDFLIKFYHLELDDNKMIIFTKEFPFNEDVKQEALFIWWILHITHTDKFVGKYPQYLKYILQTKFEKVLYGEKSNRNLKIDLCFPLLNISFENNELHHEDDVEKIKDNVKEAMVNLHSNHLLSLQMANIYDKKIKDHPKKNINCEIKNCKALKEFAEFFVSRMTKALMDFIEPRKHLIMQLCKEHITEEIQEYINTLNLYCTELMTLNKNSKEYCELEEEIIELSQNGKKKQRILDDFNNPETFDLLFKLKERSEKSCCYEVITYKEIIKLFKIKSNMKNEIIILRNILKKLNIIKRYQSDDKILISWVKLAEVIYNYEDDQGYKEMLEVYHRILGKSYEKVVNMMLEHSLVFKNLSPKFDLYFATINKKMHNIKNQEIQKYIDKETKTNDIIKDMKKQIKNSNKTIKERDKIIEELKNKYEPVIISIQEVQHIEENNNVFNFKELDDFDDFLENIKENNEVLIESDIESNEESNEEDSDEYEF